MIYLTLINYGHRSLKFLAQLHLSITNISNFMICDYKWHISEHLNIDEEYKEFICKCNRPSQCLLKQSDLSLIFNIYLWQKSRIYKKKRKKKVIVKKVKIEIYTSSESWINKLSIDVWFVRIVQYFLPRYIYLKIWNLRVQKNLNIEKIAFKIVQLKFLAMHITNQKWSFDIFTVGNLQNIFMEHDLYLIS